MDQMTFTVTVETDRESLKRFFDALCKTEGVTFMNATPA